MGANNGISALGIHSILPLYQIYSVEANPQHEQSLKSLKGKLANFDYKIVAAGNVSGSLKLHVAQYKSIPLHTAASVNPEYMTNAFINNYSEKVISKITWKFTIVDILPLDDLKLKPDLIKIDVEGFDFEVLMGLKVTIDECRPSILIEYSPSQLNRFESFCIENRYGMYVYILGSNDFIKLFDYKKSHNHQKNLPLNIYLIPDEVYQDF